MEDKLKGKPVYEVYSIKKEEVVKLIQENHGELRYLIKDWGVGKDYVDYLYFVSKK